MMIKDKPNAWGFTWPGKETDTIYYDDGTTAPLTTNQLVVPFGKYRDFTLSEVSDRNYLEWMEKKAREDDDWWMEETVSLRLKELE